MRTVLLIEPYFAGSHRAWAEGYAAASRHRVELLALPGRFWKWRMQGAAVTLAEQLLASDLRPDVLLATDMLDLAAFLGLARTRLADVPVAVYFHENQLAYPPVPVDPTWSPSRQRRAAAQDLHFAFVNYTSALAADAVLWNSAYNRDSFLAALPNLLKHYPDFNDLHNAARIAAKSQVLPLGLDLARLDRWRPAEPRQGPLLILWNHRWEHDKGPEEFFAVLRRLVDQGLPFRVAILGENPRQEPTEFTQARAWLGDRVAQFGYVEEPAAYAAWLWRADVVVSCARHEFFGASVVEAMYCEAWPLLPQRLVYPELIPPAWHTACLYRDADDLARRLAWAAQHPDEVRQRSLRPVAAQFDWRCLAPRYDDLLEALIPPRSPGG